ncbi:hypothetical protein CHGG_10986 [Chaetomium globosum CBS 148.51]|uniref:SET domain-containing protein n=1 Tax=Chaetomium globosum (strain ATCC 6205 / CBS 148.51 / DSM 1962 / NBRC 6347 / NRRL 1970) TaxID=306901 RepID=Q2GM18_CHAGB|nr:uncharacterized protein CHGG_10986 [Chaetomium globosum CBS 148.51]EAQ83168.1 hypothetical protein CHGG_10986 [Chaetomium globosum CBS 148.51]
MKRNRSPYLFYGPDARPEHLAPRHLQDNLARLAKENAVLLKGVRLKDIPGRGAGMVAHRRLKRGQKILRVPTQLVHSLHTVPERISGRLPPDMSIHALLAANLTVDGMAGLSTWKDSLPTLGDFNTGLPFMWHKELQELLPKPARELLKKQQDSFHRDWNKVAKAFPDLRQDDYLHSWFVINTRTFYYATPRTEKYPPVDRLAIVPIADFFNHADTGCEVTFDKDGFIVSADRDYHGDQEVYISYGAHTNDFLLAEYGFLPAANRWDEVCVDEVILPKPSTAHKELLQGEGLLGPFMLDSETLGCKKTQAAVRLLCCGSRGQWKESLDGEGCGEHCRGEAYTLLRSLLVDYSAMVGKAVQDVGGLQVGQAAQRELLEQRWRQVDTIVTQALSHLQSLSVL